MSHNLRWPGAIMIFLLALEGIAIGIGNRKLGFLVMFLQFLGAVWFYFCFAQPLKDFWHWLCSGAQEDLACENALREEGSGNCWISQALQMLHRATTIMTKKNSMEIYNKQSEITALQSQINPHFLYNTLDSIRGKALAEGNRQIAKMVEALAAFFRYSISNQGTLVTLREELANIQNYITIQQYRFDNRFQLEIIMDEEDRNAYHFRIPKLIVQPIIENAIYHGLEEARETGKVTIEIIVTDLNLILTISDNGRGMNTQELTELNRRMNDKGLLPDNSEKKGSGIALRNIHQRIQLLFGEDYGVHIYSTPNQGTDVEVTLPIRNTEPKNMQ